MSDMTDLERRCVDASLDAYLSHTGKMTVGAAELLRVRAVLAEAGVDELMHLVRCYRDDLRYPPSADSIERRLEAIDRALAKVQP